MSDLIKTDTIFGKRANVVGNISADLVLESLGKIYIKSRNSAKTLEEVIKSVALGDINETVSRTRIVEGLENIDTSSLKEGLFIFDKLSNILYLWIDGDFLELINVAPEGTGYVKRSGDTMTGRLTINVPNGPPLSVNSTELVLNLNVGYLLGESGKNFTKRNHDEKIIGSWQFKNPTKFESNALFARDIVVNGSVGSSNFASGFGGYGWRMDADTNTLTVDNLVVRRLMLVYELVVNKISATNGSLWVTNAGKVVSAYKLPEFQLSSFTNTELTTFKNQLYNGVCFINYNNYREISLSADALQNNSGTVLNGGNFPHYETLKNARVIIVKDAELLKSSNGLSDGCSIYNLFDENFKFNVNFPIIARPKYLLYKDCLEYVNTDFESDSDELDYISSLNARYNTNYNSNDLINIANTNPKSLISLIKSYYKYYSKGDYYLVLFDNDELPVFKPGDLLRCQKWTYGGIKYYDAIVCNQLDNSALYIILVAKSILDYSTTISYNDALEATVINNTENINVTLYEQSNKWVKPLQPIIEIDDNGNSIEVSVEEQIRRRLIGIVEEKDSLVQIGNLWDYLRQNAVYITSTDDGAPFIDTLSGINRPDYSVIYYIPIYKTVKLYKSAKTSNNAVDVPYTGDYYILDRQYHDLPENCAEYVLVQNLQGRHLLKCTSGTQTDTSGLLVIYWLTTIPNYQTLLGEASLSFNLLWEDGGKILVWEDTLLTYVPLIQEELYALLTLASTRTTKVRIGNLDGIQDEIFPINKLPYGYGLYGLNVFLTGEFYLSNGQSLAEISKDAITFAVASSRALKDSLYHLREETEMALKLLEDNVYTKGDLFTSGFYLKNAQMILWGNKIQIATTRAELKGDTAPTALFENGRISAKYIQLYDIHSSWHPTNLTPKKVTQIIKEKNGIPYYTEVEVTKKTINGIDVYDSVNYPASERHPIWQYTNDSNQVIEVVDGLVYDAYDTYGWHLKALGDGYLALGNISWDELGKLDIVGSITLKGTDDIFTVKNEFNEVFKISNKTIPSSNLSEYNAVFSNSTLFNGSINSLSQNCSDDESRYVNIIDLYNLEITLNNGNVVAIKFETSNITLYPVCQGGEGIQPEWTNEYYNDTIELNFGYCDDLYRSQDNLISPNFSFDSTGNKKFFSVTCPYNSTTLSYSFPEKIVYSNLNAEDIINIILINWLGHRLLSLNYTLTIKLLEFKSEIGSNFFNILSMNNVFTIGPEYITMLNKNANGIIITDGHTYLVKDDLQIDLYDKLKDLGNKITALDGRITALGG